jgi:hypothetical protein
VRTYGSSTSMSVEMLSNLDGFCAACGEPQMDRDAMPTDFKYPKKWVLTTCSVCKGTNVIPRDMLGRSRLVEKLL